jgi:hypothetical protein
LPLIGGASLQGFPWARTLAAALTRVTVFSAPSDRLVLLGQNLGESMPDIIARIDEALQTIEGLSSG